MSICDVVSCSSLYYLKYMDVLCVHRFKTVAVLSTTGDKIAL